MGMCAAKKGDQVVGVDIHIILIPAAAGVPVPTPLPHPFIGKIVDAVSTDVNIMGMPAATKDSIAKNIPPHIPQGGPFQKPPMNEGKIMMGSATVKINGKMAARMGDLVLTCNDPTDLPNGTVIAISTVFIGG